jgi:flagellar biosynthesis chaperone FliJ
MNNMSQLSKLFGIEFENTAVKDERINGGLATMPIITDIVAHPAVEGLRSVLMPSACSLRVSGDATIIATTSGTADPANAPVVAIGEFGKGRVMCVGSYEVFRRGGGLKHEGNSVFAISAFRWLTAGLWIPRPSEVAAAQTPPDKAQSAPLRAGPPEAPPDMEHTLKRLVNVVIDLQKDIAKVTDKVDGVDDNIRQLRDQFHDFAKKTRSQLGVVIPADQFQTEDEQKTAQAETDVKVLEKEIESVRQLKEHVEQKLASGTMTRDTYEEQVQKLDTKLTSLEKRIEMKRKNLEETAQS